MRNLLIVAGLLCVAVGLMPHIKDAAFKPNPSAMSARAETDASAATSAGARTVSIPRDNRGHFQVGARVDGRRIDFMVDTGASTIVLSSEAARRVGINPVAKDFTVSVSTANGVARAAPVMLSRVEIGDLTVRDVRALVASEGALSENLLGLSFLTKLRRFEYANGKLVLEQ